jgi:hypothetical protein
MKLSEKCMLVSLFIKCYSGRKNDKRVAEKVATDNGAAADAGRYSKLVISKQRIKELQKLASAVRTIHYTYTSPWSDDGRRMLPAAAFDKYAAEVRKAIALYDSAVAKFVADFDDLKEQRRIELNGLFCESDYPSTDQLRSDFLARFNVTPITDENDFRVTLSDDETEKIRAAIKRDCQDNLQGTLMDCWQRLYDAVNHMSQKLADGDSVFRDSLVGNVRELVDLLPLLNVSDDQNLIDAVDAVKTELCDREPKELRTEPTARKEQAAAAAKIVEAMGAFMGD